jgi:hypothetical protein
MIRTLLAAALVAAGVGPAAAASEDLASPIWLAPTPGSALTHLSAAGSTLIKTGKGWLSTISINTPATGSLTVYDGTNGSGTVLGVIDTSKNTTASGLTPWPFQVGCYVVLVGNADITIVTH